MQVSAGVLAAIVVVGEIVGVGVGVVGVVGVDVGVVGVVGGAGVVVGVLVVSVAGIRVAGVCQTG